MARPVGISSAIQARSLRLMINDYLDMALEYSLAGWVIAIKCAGIVLLTLSSLEILKSGLRACLKRRSKRSRRH